MTKIFDLDVRMVDARLIVTKYIRNWRDIWTLGHFQLFLRNYETTIDENGLNDDKCSGYGTEDHQSSIDGKAQVPLSASEKITGSLIIFFFCCAVFSSFIGVHCARVE